MNIIEFIQSTDGFGKHKAFRDLSTWQNWLLFLRILYGVDLENVEQYDAFRHFTERVEVPTAPFQEVFLRCGRRGGKSFTSAVIACYEALTGNWQDRTSGGEAAAIFIIASDKSQGRNIFRYCEGLLKVAAPDQIKRATREEIELKNGAEISIRAGNYAGIRGYSLALGIVDEAAYLRDESGNYANPIQEVHRSLYPSLIPGVGKLLFLSTPRTKNGMFYTKFTEFWGKDDPDVLCWKGTTLEMHPGYISEEKVQKDLLKDKAFFSAEWEAAWREDISNLMDAARLRRAMDDHEPMPYVPDHQYLGFIDASSGKSDSFTIAVGFKERYSGQIVIARAEEFPSPFAPGDIVPRVAAIAHAYHLSFLYSDAYARGWCEESFRKENLRIEIVKESKSQLYVQFQGLLQLDQLWLPNDPRAETQFLELERTDNRDGTWRVDHPMYGGAQDDLSNSIAGCAVMLSMNTAPTLEQFEKDHGSGPVKVTRNPESIRREEWAEQEKMLKGLMEEDGQKLNRIVRR